MDVDFTYDIERQDGCLRVAVAGDFDMTGVLRLEPELGQLLDSNALDRVVLDLSELNFIDSTALGVVIDIDRRAKAGEFAFEVIPGPRHVQRVFEVTKLSETLPFRPGSPEA